MILKLLKQLPDKHAEGNSLKNNKTKMSKDPNHVPLVLKEQWF